MCVFDFPLEKINTTRNKQVICFPFLSSIFDTFKPILTPCRNIMFMPGYAHYEKKYLAVAFCTYFHELEQNIFHDRQWQHQILYRGWCHVDNWLENALADFQQILYGVPIKDDSQIS